MSALSPLQESILALVGIDNQILYALKSIQPEERIKDEDLKFTVCNHIQILLCSFLEEWRRLGRLGANTEIRKTLDIASPAITRIRRWKGLRGVRSQLLAHSHRTSDGKLVPAWEVFDRFSAPTAYAEIIVLGNCARKATYVVVKRHAEDYKLALALTESKRRQIETKGVQKVDEIKAELEKVDQQIAQRSRDIS